MATMTTQAVEILLVDDNDDDVLIIQEAFHKSRLAHIIHVVNDGVEALSYLRCDGKYHNVGLPSLVLLDINMPKKNGFEVMQGMKDDPRLRCLPIVMLTTSEREEDIIRSYASGACSYIRKPVDLSQFQKIVERFEVYWSMISKIPLPAK